MRRRHATCFLAAIACGSSSVTVERTFDPAQSSVEVTPDSSVAGGEVMVRVTVRDSAGDPIEELAVDVSVTGSANELTAVAPTDATGVTTCTLRSTRAESKTITASADGMPIGTATVTYVPGPPVVLGFAAQPTLVEAGEPFATSVEVTDQFDNRTGDSIAIHLELLPNATGAVLQGPVFGEAHAGLADFTTLHVDASGTGYILVATASGFAEAGSTPFDVVPGAPAVATSQLVATPPSADADGASAMGIGVHVANQYGIAIRGVPITISATGSGHIIAPATGTTNASGNVTSAITSTVAEVKTLTAVAGALTLETPVHFYPPACTPVFPGRPLEPLAGDAFVHAVADTDGDGILDVVVAETDRIEVFRGRGDGRFRPALVQAVSGTPVAIAAQDIDGDGRVDLVIATRSTAALRIAKGLGGGLFADPAPIPVATAPARIVIADVDKDGDPDIVASLTTANAVAIELNAGGAFTTAATIATGSAPIDIAVADVNVDGKLDVLVSNDSGSSLSSALGNGDGTFKAAVTRFTGINGALLVGNFDGDTSPDLVIAETRGERVAVHHGNRDGTFTQVASFSTGNTNANALASDVDGDGKLDLVLGGTGMVTILAGTGAASFGAATRYALAAFAGVAHVDMDRDGRRDLVTVGFHLGVSRGVAGGRFVAADVTVLPRSFLLPITADFDRDGLLDLVRFDFQVSAGMIAMLANRDRTFRDGPVAVHAQPTEALAGDLDGDGRTDLLVARSGSAIAADVALGDGAGGFGAFTAIAGSASGRNPVLEDLDADGHLDLVMAGAGPASSTLLVARGLGTGAFGPFTLVPTGRDPRTTVATDVDGDGALDLVTATPGDQTISVVVGDGAGGFGAPTASAIVVRDVLLARDFDGDGVAELVGVPGDGTIVVLHQTAGVFTILDTYRIDSVFSGSVDVASTDVDGDGTLDLVVEAGRGVSVLQGFGDGYFRPPRFYGWSGAAPGPGVAAVTAADHDGDGRPDIAVSNGFGIVAAFQGTCIPFAP